MTIPRECYSRWFDGFREKKVDGKWSVPVQAYGPGAELFEGLFDNTGIAKYIARLLDFGK